MGAQYALFKSVFNLIYLLLQKKSYDYDRAKEATCRQSGRICASIPGKLAKDDQTTIDKVTNIGKVSVAVSESTFNDQYETWH